MEELNISSLMTEATPQNIGSTQPVGPSFVAPEEKAQLSNQNLPEDKPIRAWMEDNWLTRVFANTGLQTAKGIAQLGEAVGVLPQGRANDIPQVNPDKMSIPEDIASLVMQIALPLGAISKIGKATGVASKLEGLSGVGGNLARLGYRTGEVAAVTPFLGVNQNISGIIKEHQQALGEATSPGAIDAIASLTAPIATDKEDSYWAKLGKTIIEGAALNETVRVLAKGITKSYQMAKGSSPEAGPMTPEEFLGYKKTLLETGRYTDEQASAMATAMADQAGIRVSATAEISDAIASDSAWARIKRSIADKAERLITFEKSGLKFQKETGQDLGFTGELSKEKLSPHMAFSNTKGLGAIVEADAERNVKPIFEKIANEEQLDEFATYWLHKTDRAKQAQGKASPFAQVLDEQGNVISEGRLPKALIDQVIASGDANPMWQEALQKIEKINVDLLHWAQKEAQLFTPEALDHLIRTRGSATSLYRVQDKNLISIGDNFLTRTYKKDPTRRAMEGSTNQDTEFMDPVEAFIKNRIGIMEAVSNVKAQKLFFDRIKALNNAGEAGQREASKWAIPVVETKAINEEKARIFKEAEKAGVQVKEYAARTAGSDESLTRQMASRSITAEDLSDLDFINMQSKFVNQPKRGDIQFTIEKGRLAAYKIMDQGIATAFAGYGPNAASFMSRIPWFDSLARGSKNLFTQLVTKNPEFALFSNPIKDSWSAFTMGQGLTSLPIINIVKGMYLQIRKDPIVKEFLENGGGYASLYRGESKTASVLAEDFYRVNKQDMNLIANTPKKIWDLWSNVVEKVENSVRVDYYKGLRSQGYNPEVAIFHARNISTDFARSGSSAIVQEMNHWIPFFNASIQGTYRLIRAFSQSTLEAGDKSYFKTKVLFGGILPAMTAYYYNMQDQRFKDENTTMKDTHMYFSTETLRRMITDITGSSPWEEDKNAPYYKIPKAHEIGAMQTVGEKLIDSVIKNDGMIVAQAMVKTILQMVRADSSGSFIPQLSRPFVELGMNQNSFGTPIVAENQNGLPDTQFNDRTSKTAIAGAGVLNSAIRAVGASPNIGISPIQLEHLMYGYFGGLAKAVDDYVVSPMIGAAMKMPERPDRVNSEKYLTRRIFADDVPKNSQPMFDMFKLEKNAEQYEKSLAPLIGKTEANFFKMLTDLEVEKMTKLLDDKKTLEYLGARPALKAGMDQIVEWNNLIKVISFSNDSPASKKIQIEQLNAAKNELARDITYSFYGKSGFEHLSVDKDREGMFGLFGFRLPLMSDVANEKIRQYITYDSSPKRYAEGGVIDTDYKPTPQDIHYVAQTMYGEAGNEPEMGIYGVGHVIKNRFDQGNYADYRSVVQAKNQFEAWDKGFAQKLTPNNPRYKEFYDRANEILSGKSPDPTNGALNFYNPEKASPSWGNTYKETAVIGRHRFMHPDPNWETKGYEPVINIKALLSNSEPPVMNIKSLFGGK